MSQTSDSKSTPASDPVSEEGTRGIFDTLIKETSGQASREDVIRSEKKAFRQMLNSYFMPPGAEDRKLESDIPLRVPAKPEQHASLNVVKTQDKIWVVQVYMCDPENASDETVDHDMQVVVEYLSRTMQAMEEAGELMPPGAGQVFAVAMLGTKMTFLERKNGSLSPMIMDADSSGGMKPAAAWA